VTKLDLNLTAVAALIEGRGDKYDLLENAFTWARSPQGEDFWISECSTLEMGGKLSVTAQEHLKGFMRDALKPAAEEIAAQAPAADPFPARALAFGQPQIMGGTGQWDNLRYAANEEDERGR
jgi:hypothetical protein